MNTQLKRKDVDHQRDFTLRYEPTIYVLKELQDAAEFGKDTPYVVQSIASAVANLIAASGKQWGDMGMTRMMDLVAKYGFQPEYWGGTIRVTYISPTTTRNRWPSA